MKLSELYNQLKENEPKIPVIDEITRLHPGIGSKIGWSWYIGGMSDSGDWYIDKLLQQPLDVLQNMLYEWTAPRGASIDTKSIKEKYEQFWKDVNAQFIFGVNASKEGQTK